MLTKPRLGREGGAMADRDSEGVRVFDSSILKDPMSVLPQRGPICFSREQYVSEAMHAMQKEHRGCVLVTEAGGPASPLIGIFTERDILYRIIDRGRNHHASRQCQANRRCRTAVDGRHGCIHPATDQRRRQPCLNVIRVGLDARDAGSVQQDQVNVRIHRRQSGSRG